eukprot:1056966-Prorocentrum_minimum.AAC.1
MAVRLPHPLLPRRSSNRQYSRNMVWTMSRRGGFWKSRLWGVLDPLGGRMVGWGGGLDPPGGQMVG